MIALSNLAVVLAIIPGIEKWNPAEKDLAARIIKAKASSDEALYLRLMQKHDAWRQELLRLGT
jgi:hypothetical protein